MKILLFMVIINLTIGMVVALALPGTAFFSPIEAGGNTTQYEEKFNSTKTAESWSATPFSGVPIIGDVFSGFYLIFTNWQFLIDGFPYLLTWISDSYITNNASETAFDVIANVLRAVYAILMATFLYYIITGRDI